MVLVTRSCPPMLIDSPEVMRAIFQRCRNRARISVRGLDEVLGLGNEILRVVEHQGKFLIDVPEDALPQKWVSAVKADTQRAIEYRQAMQRSDYELLTPEHRRQIALLRLLVRELQRLVAMGENYSVYRLGYAFHNVHRVLSMPEETDKGSALQMFRVISADWDMLSMEMREDSCRVVGLERSAAEAMINTPGFSINRSGIRQFRIKTLLSSFTGPFHQDEDVHVVGTVKEVVMPEHFVLEDETSAIAVKVSGGGSGELVASSEGKRAALHGAVVDVRHQELPNRPLVILQVHAESIRLVPDATSA